MLVALLDRFEWFLIHFCIHFSSIDFAWFVWRVCIEFSTLGISKCVFYWKNAFQKTRLSRTSHIFDQFSDDFGSIFRPFWHHFSIFFDINFYIDFGTDFWSLLDTHGISKIVPEPKRELHFWFFGDLIMRMLWDSILDVQDRPKIARKSKSKVLQDTTSFWERKNL